MKTFFFTIISVAVLMSCGGSGSKASLEAYQTKIDSLEKERTVYLQEGKFPPSDLIRELIQVYEFRAADYPDDEKSPHYLFMAAQRYDVDLQDYTNAIKRYQEVYEKYDRYENRPMALFHVGNAYHSMNDTTNAIATFKSFTREFPDHDFTDDAEGMIEFIRMGEDAFFEKIRKQSQQDSIVG